MPFKRAAIIGVGLIGASLARALKKHALAAIVTGCGRSSENLDHALKSGFVDHVTHDLEEAVKGSDLVVLATPVETFEVLAQAMAGYLDKGALVIDVGSVKGALVERLQRLMPEGVEFVGCHPIAGSENAGSASSIEGLFEGADCLITPTSSNTDEAVARVSALWESLGSSVRIMDPLEHDELLGLVSHFPHLAAYAMINAIEDKRGGAIALSGAGLKDTTRIAMSPSALWREISLSNRDNIVPVLEGFIKELDTMRESLEKDDGDALEAILRRAELRRRAIAD